MQDIASLTDIPLSGLTVDSQGNLFGVGTEGAGGVFDYEVSHLASSIAFANEPVGDPVGQPMAPVFVNAPSGTRVTLALGNDTTGAVLTDPGGSLTATAVNGQATFKGLEVNLPGTYDLVAVAAGPSDPEPAVRGEAVSRQFYLVGPGWKPALEHRGKLARRGRAREGSGLDARFSRRRPAKLQQR